MLCLDGKDLIWLLDT